MRNYQRTKDNPYLLPHNLYMRVLYIIKDYDRLKDEYHAILDYSSGPNIDRGIDRHGNEVAMYSVHGKGVTSDPTENKAIKLALMFDELHAIEQALMMIPREYQQGLMQNIKYGVQYPDTAHYNTWRNWRYRLMWYVAKRLNLI